MRDKKVRQAFYTHPRYHRLNIEFNGEEPRLDNTTSIPELKSKIQGDRSLSEIIDNIARCAIVSLFYFKLDSIPGRNDGKHVGSGRILYSLRCHDPAFHKLLGQFSSISAQFCLNERPVAAVNDPSCFDKDGNFRRQIELNTTDRFAISLK